jgi:hypothetical protein
MRLENIPNTFWDEYDDALRNESAVFVIWASTNPKCNMAGAYRCPRRLLVEGRIPEDQLQVALDEAEDAGLVYYRENIVWVRERVAHLTSRNTQMAKSVAKAVEDIRGTAIYEYFLAEYCAANCDWLIRRLRDNNQKLEAYNEEHGASKSFEFVELIDCLERGGSVEQPYSGRSTGVVRNNGSTSGDSVGRPYNDRWAKDEDVDEADGEEKSANRERRGNSYLEATDANAMRSDGSTAA